MNSSFMFVVNMFIFVWFRVIFGGVFDFMEVSNIFFWSLCLVFDIFDVVVLFCCVFCVLSGVSLSKGLQVVLEGLVLVEMEVFYFIYCVFDCFVDGDGVRGSVVGLDG